MSDLSNHFVSERATNQLGSFTKSSHFGGYWGRGVLVGRGGTRLVFPISHPVFTRILISCAASDFSEGGGGGRGFAGAFFWSGFVGSRFSGGQRLLGSAVVFLAVAPILQTLLHT